VTRAWHAANPDRRAAWVDKRKADPALYRVAGWRHQGIDVAQATAALRSHDGTCALCGAEDPGTKKGWAVDHCHDTGRVRGVLCFGCNTGLGAFKDDAARLSAAIEYLSRSAK